MSERLTLAQLEIAAASDLANPTKAAQLKWVFLHAKAVGHYEVARGTLKRVEQLMWEAEMRSRSEWTLGNTEAAQNEVARKPVDALVAKTEAEVVEASACVEATRQIVALLGRAGERAMAAPASSAGPASRSTGQVSQTRTTPPSPGGAARTATAQPRGYPAPTGRPVPGK